MIHELLETVRQALGQNPIMSGGLVLMFTGSIIALLRKVPTAIWRWIVRNTTVCVDIASDDPIFVWLEAWFNKSEHCERSTRLIARAGSASTSPNSITISERRVTDNLPVIIFSPARGMHWIRWEGKWIKFDRRREKETAVGGFTSWKDEITLTTFGRDRTILRRFIEAARAVVFTSAVRYTDIYSVGIGSGWSYLGAVRVRPSSSIILPAGLLEDLIQDLREFLNSHDWYIERGIPWRRGYLFEGPPGNGKTSLALAMAAAANASLNYLSLVGDGLVDSRLRELLTNRGEGNIILIEDVDRGFESLKDQPGKDIKLTYGAVLNCLDGACASDGQIVIMTANDASKLDKALLRPGRIDRVVKFRNADQDQACELFRRFFPDKPLLAGRFGVEAGNRQYAMAELQQMLLEHRNDPEAVIRNVTQSRIRNRTTCETTK